MIVDMPVGAYRPCDTCGAPVLSPFPDDWHIDLTKEGPRFGPVETFYTPHTADCAQPMPTYAEDTGITVRIAGQHVTRVSLRPPSVLADTPGRIPLAATGDEFQATGPLHWLDGAWPVHLNGEQPE